MPYRFVEVPLVCMRKPFSIGLNGIRPENRPGHRAALHIQIPLQRYPPQRAGGRVTG